MTTFAWQFTELVVLPSFQGLTNVVECMNWRLTASDGLGHTAMAYGCLLYKSAPADD